MSDARTQRKSLGRGLSALLSNDEAPAATPPADGPAPRTAPLSDLAPNPDQPRRHFADADIESLAASIAEKGLLQPILVRPSPKGAGWEIVAGERRWRAAQRAQLHDVPILVRELDDAETLEVAIVENVQRVDLDPVEEAEGYAALIDRHGYTQERLATTVSKSRSHVANALRLLKLPQSVRDRLASGGLTAGHARALVGHPQAEALAARIEKEGLSVRAAEALASDDGSTPRPARATRGAPAPAADADTAALAADLSAALGAAVEIEHKGKGGRLVIRYADLEQLDALCGKLGLGEF